MKGKHLISLLLCLAIAAGALGISACTKRPKFDPNEKEEDIEEITIFKNDWAGFNNAKQKNTAVYAKLKETIGCDIRAENGSGETWMQQLVLRQANGELPEIFLTEGPQSPDFFRKLIEEGDIIAISDWATQEDYPNLYRYMQQFDYMKQNISYAGGKTWFVPSKWENEKSLYVRQDWLDNLNAKLDSILVKEGVVASESQVTDDMRAKYRYGAPKTLVDFYRLARAFTLYDPNNSGANDTYGYMSESNMDMDAWVHIAFGTGWQQFVADGEGGYTVSDITDEAMYATAYLNRLMAEGYMTRDSITADMDTKQTKFMQGKVGMIYAHNWLNTFVSGIMDIERCTLEQATAKILMCDPPAGRDGAWGGAGGAGYWQGFCINANMSEARIRKCLQLYDYLASPEGTDMMVYGIEGVHYTIGEDGEKVSKLGANDKGFNFGIEEYDPATLLYALVWWTGHYNLTTATNADIIVPRQQRSAQNVYRSDYPDVQTDAMVENLKSCHDYFETNAANMILDQKKIYNSLSMWEYDAKTFGWEQIYTVSKNYQAAWKTFVKKYKQDYRGEAMIAEYNQYIASGKAVKVQ